MPLFTPRDRIAIAVFGTLILAGWGTRLFLLHSESREDLRIIRSAVTPPAHAPSDSLSAPGVSPGPHLLDLNRATAAELETLPLIGPAKAASIVRWRGEHGPFQRTADIMEVKGIGPKILERIAPYVTVGDSLSPKPKVQSPKLP